MDGLREELTHRQIAVLMYDEAKVARHWFPDTNFRKQVRYWIDRAKEERDRSGPAGGPQEE